MTETILFMVGLPIITIAGLFLYARRIKKTDYWLGDHYETCAGMIIWHSVVGVILASIFTFDGTSPFYAALAQVGYMTFLYPFLLFGWVSDWPKDRFKIKDHGLAIIAALVFLALSMLILGLTVTFTSLNYGVAPDDAWIRGTLTFVISLILILALGAFGEKLSVSG